MSNETFWSRRRAAVAREALAEREAARHAARAKAEAALTERDDAEILRELGLPEPEALDTAQAVRDFLGAAVPQRLKTRALRRLWRLDPVLANLDGLVDYGQDFTDKANVIAQMQTAYQVGKGMMAQFETGTAADAAQVQADQEAPGHKAPGQQADAKQASQEMAGAVAPPDGLQSAEAEPSVAHSPAPAPIDPGPQQAEAAESPAAPLRASNRRMTFHFGDEA